MVNNIMSIHQYNAKNKQLKLELIFDQNIPEYVLLDELRNGQIINNLMSNAIKFTSQGKIEFKVSNIFDSKDDIILQFQVTDTGIGIAETKLEYIFHEFTQANEDHSRKFGGTGLGLAITKKLIELQGGKITVKSVVDKGTTITYQIKYKKHVINHQLLSVKDLEKTVSFNREKILLVEDNEVNIMVAKKYLEKWNLNVLVAKDGLEAIKMCSENKFSLVLMDFHMPNMDGVTATSKIREFDKETIIIGLSADVTSDLIYNFEKYQMNGFVSKPFKSKDLFSVIATHLNNQKSS